MLEQVVTYYRGRVRRKSNGERAKATAQKRRDKDGKAQTPVLGFGLAVLIP
jgi:hypothetical protein